MSFYTHFILISTVALAIKLERWLLIIEIEYHIFQIKVQLHVWKQTYWFSHVFSSFSVQTISEINLLTQLFIACIRMNLNKHVFQEFGSKKKIKAPKQRLAPCIYNAIKAGTNPESITKELEFGITSSGQHKYFDLWISYNKFKIDQTENELTQGNFCWIP